MIAILVIWYDINSIKHVKMHIVLVTQYDINKDRLCFISNKNENENANRVGNMNFPVSHSNGSTVESNISKNQK